MLPSTFRFNQSNLQDYVDCPRRFQLRYIKSQAWPAASAEPLLEYERHLERGTRFHRLIERHQLGIDTETLTASITDDPQLTDWWQRYLEFDFLHELTGQRYPEMTLSATLGSARLTATFDLLVVNPGETMFIFDWKTYARPPARTWLTARLQTRVYPYIITRGGSTLFGDDLKPDHVTMIYWIVSASEPVVFDYDHSVFERDQAYLLNISRQILDSDPEIAWPLTTDESRCRFCVYRSFCGRGDIAGAFEELYDEVPELELGLSDVEEVGF